jgi:hypothetical protein
MIETALFLLILPPMMYPMLPGKDYVLPLQTLVFPLDRVQVEIPLRRHPKIPGLLGDESLQKTRIPRVS